MVGVAGYADAVPRDRDRASGSSAARQRRSARSSFRTSSPTRTTGRPATTSEARSRRPSSTSGELLGVVNFEGTARPSDRAGAGRACRDGRPRTVGRRSGRRASMTSGATACYAIERVLEVSRALVADLDRPRIVASIVDAVAELLDADVVALFSRRVDGIVPARGRRRLPGAGDRPRGPWPRAAWSVAPSSNGPGSTGSRRPPPGPPSSSTTDRAAIDPACRDGAPDRGRRRGRRGPVRHPDRRGSHVQRASSAGSPTS